MGRLHLRLAHGSTEYGGVDRANQALAETLCANFEIVEDPRHAQLQVCSHQWDAPLPPRRLFIDHGAFADASFWAYTAPRLRRDDTILVTSRVCETIAERQFGAARPALRRLPLCVDTGLFRPAQDRRQARRQLARRHGIPAGGPLLLTVSSYSRRKNLHLALRLLAEVRQRLPDTRLALVGRPSASQQAYASGLRQLSDELGLADHLHLLTPMPHAELHALMSGADALVHLTTCRIENFGLVVAEALASGLPVIAADWGGLRDLVQQAASGYLARTWLTTGGPRVDWRGAAAATRRLLLDEGLSRAAGARGAAFARRALAPALFDERLCAIVREILEQGAAPGGHVSLSPRGEELMFATIRLHRERAGLRSTSAEYRALLDVEPELCRWLTGPAASFEEPPPVTREMRVYPVVGMRAADGTTEVTDPAWEATLTLTPVQAALAAAADGRPLAETAAGLGLSPAQAVEAARFLFAAGVLGALDEGWPDPS